MSQYRVPNVRGLQQANGDRFTHAIIGRPDWDKLLLEAGHVSDSELADYDWFVENTNTPEGAVMQVTKTFSYLQEQGDIDEAVKQLMGCKTRYQWAEHVKNIRQCNVLFEMECVGENSLQVLRFCRAEVNAYKVLKDYEHFLNVKIVPIQLV